MTEAWRPIPGYEGIYEVSSLGRVRSLDRVIIRKDGQRRFYRGVMITGAVKPDGYRMIHLSVNRQCASFNLHRIVALLFVDNPDDLPEVNHKNGDKLDNRAENLEWTTRGLNILHAYRTGLRKQPSGEDSNLSKLDWATADRIRQLAADGLRTSLIAEQVGLSPGHVRKIVRGDLWVRSA